MKTMKTIGIVGSRRRSSIGDFKKLKAAFDDLYEPGDRIVSGGCPHGADGFAETIAKEEGITIVIHYPRKENLDKNLLKINPRAAYAQINYARNTLIAKECDVLIALCAKDRTGGTEDTVRKTVKLRKRIIHV